VAASHPRRARLHPDETPRDRLLDFALSLRDAIRGKAEGARSVEQVNRALHEAFGSFVMWDAGGPLKNVEVAGTHAIEPILRPEVALSLFDWPAVLDEPAAAPRWSG